MVSIDRSTHPHFFIRRAGCRAGVGFPGRCQLLLHTVGVPLAGEFGARLEMYTSRTKQYGTSIRTNETVWYFNGTGDSTLLHYYLINSVANSHV